MWEIQQLIGFWIQSASDQFTEKHYYFFMEIKFSCPRASSSCLSAAEETVYSIKAPLVTSRAQEMFLLRETQMDAGSAPEQDCRQPHHNIRIKIQRYAKIQNAPYLCLQFCQWWIEVFIYSWINKCFKLRHLLHRYAYQQGVYHDISPLWATPDL